jgi:hypothetical protein
MQVTLDPTGLPQGVNSGSITISAGRFAPIMVPVSLTVTGPCVPTSAKLSKTSIAQSVTVGGNAVAETITVTDNCGGSLPFTAGPASVAAGNPSWISYPAEGTGSLPVSFSMGQLAIGTYTTTIRIAPTATTYAPMDLPVQINVQKVVVDAIKVNSGVEVIAKISPQQSHLYVGEVKSAGPANFVLATKDWNTYQHMIVMYGGANCEISQLPNRDDYDVIRRLVVAGAQDMRDGKVINGRTFYWLMPGSRNEEMLIGSGRTTPAPAGCYYIYIFNTETALTGDYSFTFTDL